MKVIFIEQDNIAAAWEEAVSRCWQEGSNFSTQYDRPGDPPSKDCTMLLHVIKPMEEPRYHLGMCMGLEDLEKYVQEVVYGVHDHWMNDDSNPNKWTYTYHERLFGYGPVILDVEDDVDFVHQEDVFFNQIENCIDQLKECGYTRRAQAVTWQPWVDPNHNDPPCLQSLWFRIENNKLNMNVRFRSNDLLKAAFPNMIALTELQSYVAREVGVVVGEYIHISDSMHIYGKDFSDAEKLISLVGKRTFEERVMTAKQAAPSFAEGCRQLLAENIPEYKKDIIQERMKRWEHLGEDK